MATIVKGMMMDAEDKADAKKGIKQTPAEEKSDVAVLPHQMVRAIKNSKKGVLPPGLAKYIANKKAMKAGK